jgi:hypothetical protein
MKLAGVIAAAAFLLLPLSASADIFSDVHFTPDGTVTGTSLTIMQKTGHNFFTRATWGLAFIRITIITNASTTVTKAHGESASVDDVQEGDIFDMAGTLNFSGDTISVNAKTIRDTSLQSTGMTLTGSVKSINLPAQTFVLSNTAFGTTSIRMADGAAITKGARTIFLPDVAVGDKVLSAVGTYDYGSNTLTASSVELYQSSAMFTPRNFQGTLKSLAGTSLPTSAVVTVSGTDYTVYLAQGASVLNSAKGKASLTRFVVGDTVRFYGSIRRTDFSQADADVFRDLNF